MECTRRTALAAVRPSAVGRRPTLTDCGKRGERWPFHVAGRFIQPSRYCAGVAPIRFLKCRKKFPAAPADCREDRFHLVTPSQSRRRLIDACRAVLESTSACSIEMRATVPRAAAAELGELFERDALGEMPIDLPATRWPGHRGSTHRPWRVHH